jgi:predicted neuraminidase
MQKLQLFYRIFAIALLGAIVFSGLLICYCDSLTHTSPFNVVEGIRDNLFGHKVAHGSCYPVSGIQLANGSILATWSTLIDDYDNTDSINGSLSGDGGITWSEPFTLVKNRGYKLSEQQYVYNNGSLYEFYSTSNETKYLNGTEPSRVYVRQSLDGSVTNWSEDVMISNWTRYFAITSPPIQLTSGRWVIPVEYTIPAEYANPGNATHQYSSVWYSDDFFLKGLSAHWNQGGIIDNPTKSLNELSIVQTSNGNIVGLMRFDSIGHFWETTSSDGGITWSNPKQSNIICPNARAHIMRLSDGRILLLWNDNQKERNPISVAILNPDATAIVSKTNITGRAGGIYHNMGIVQKSDGDVLILASTNDIPESYWQLPNGMFYVTQYASGVQAFNVHL